MHPITQSAAAQALQQAKGLGSTVGVSPNASIPPAISPIGQQQTNPLLQHPQVQQALSLIGNFLGNFIPLLA